jgi:hypothetical protein
MDRTESATNDTQTPERHAGQNPRIPEGQPLADSQASRPESLEQPLAERGEEHTTDNTPGMQEAANHEQEPLEQQGEQGTERGRKAAEDSREQDANETNETNPQANDSSSSGPNESEESGRELAPHDEHPVETRPGRFSGRMSISVDDDGRPLPERHPGAESETPGRGELRDPADDRTSRDYQEPNPEKRSRSREFLRGFVTKADNIQDAADKFTEPAQKKLERVHPTGQLSGERVNNDHIKAPDQSISIATTALGAVSTVIVLTQLGRQGFKLIQRIRDGENARN